MGSDQLRLDVIDVAVDECGHRGAQNVTRRHVEKFVALAGGDFDLAIAAIVDIANGRTNHALRERLGVA